MTRALIGYTGFVGSNLRDAGHYDAFYNSANSTEMRGREFDEVVCAGVSAVKWKANREPDADWAQISALIENLRQLRVRRFVLISTVDVYQHPIGVTEDDAADEQGAAYGVHRAKLERFVAETFPNHAIVRLPALYGPGLRKNAIYDLQHDNMIEAINPGGCFQWYDVSCLHGDLKKIAEGKVKLINIAAEPVRMSEIGDRFFPGKLRPLDPLEAAPRYDMHTRHAPLLGGTTRYHYTREQVLGGIEAYLKAGK
ncbi:hypothetical protein QR79_10720 [Methylobacterium indicum]|uniref:NAD-dependent epimerase/dehydratase domain-containing protein n=1 Tax=Methylobacterium indicum TaxID=1775910 RepID=A0ABR5HED2_9HYPH|nr:NAD(P)-dependent oxidoreductase [Methylobacterium indicum]KMO24759.1 hypothetical protein QR79_10720 [Methylobacterium indicum]